MIGAATAVGAAALLGPAITASTADAQTASESGGVAADPVLTPRVNGLHLQFGQNASSEVIVSWHSLLPVIHPRVMLGDPTGRYQCSIAAPATNYLDAKAGVRVWAYHAAITGLTAGRRYTDAAVHDGAEPECGSVQTAPQGRQPFTFTSFGDQGTPTTGRVYVPPAGVTIPNPPYVNDNLGSPAAGDTTAGVERVQPLVHLFNGDLCYANLADDRVRTWTDFWENNSRSARHRPWMPAAGNHENELGNGPIGYQAFQTYFSPPRQHGQTDVTKGLWYASHPGPRFGMPRTATASRPSPSTPEAGPEASPPSTSRTTTSPASRANSRPSNPLRCNARAGTASTESRPGPLRGVQGAGKTAVAGRTAVAGDGSHHRRPSPCGYSPVKRNSACQGSSMWTISQ
jgi:hypothetical protein